MKPLVAIVGRPNVGKSTLLNRLAGRHVALVADTPGVTRDRIFVESRLGNREVILVDTGGFDPDPGDGLSRLVAEQAHAAIDESDLILFVCEAKTGLHPLDREAADVLRKTRKPVLCLINKVDPGARETEEHAFYSLGFETLFISASHGTGFDKLEVQAARLLEPPQEQVIPPDGTEPGLRICLIGRPNVGKSSVANRLSGSERQIVDHLPGTTRDAVDLKIEQRGLACTLVDTPGVRRKRKIKAKLEQHSVLAALRSLQRANVAVMVLDCSQPFADQDARLLHLAEERGKGLLVLVNKIDLLSGSKERKEYLENIAHGLRFVSYAPVLEVSARTGRGIQKIVPRAKRVFENLDFRIPTGELNRLIEQLIEALQPPLVRGRRAKIYYVSQVKVRPPTFVASVNDPERLPVHYRRYLENRLREKFPFEGVPLRWRYKKHHASEGKGKNRPKKKRKNG